MNDADFIKRVNSITEREAEIIRIEKGDHRWVFTVAAKNPESIHLVVYDFSKRRMICDCEDYHFHEPCCFHSIKAAKFLLDCMYAESLISWEPDNLKERQPALIQQKIKNRVLQFSPVLFGLGIGEPPAIPESQWKPLLNAKIGPLKPAAPAQPESRPPPPEPPLEEEAWASALIGSESPFEEEEAPSEAMEVGAEEIEPEEELALEEPEELPQLADVASELGEEVKFVLASKMTLLMPNGGWLKLGFEAMEFSIPSGNLERISQISEALLGEMISLSKKAENQLWAGLEEKPEDRRERPRLPEDLEYVTEEDTESEGFEYSEEGEDAETYWA